MQPRRKKAKTKGKGRGTGKAKGKGKNGKAGKGKSNKGGKGPPSTITDAQWGNNAARGFWKNFPNPAYATPSALSRGGRGARRLQKEEVSFAGH